MANGNVLVQIVQALLKAFCGGSGHDNQQQQQQQQQGGFAGQYPGQQQQQQQQQQYYPPQQQPFGNNQYQQPPQGVPGGQSWSQVAGGCVSPPHQPNQKQHFQQQQQQQQQQQHNQQYQPHQQNGGAWSGQKPHRPQGLPAGGIIGPHHPHAHDDNQINATNERYVQLRNQARHEGDEAHKCFAQSQNAYQSGDGARAHELSVQGKQHQKRQDDLDDEASEWIFKANNEDSPPGTIDLHGLYVKEAIERTEAAVRDAQGRGDREMRVIVGKGIHSQGHVQRIRPAVEDLMRRYNLSAHIDQHNTGVLIVDLTGSTQGALRRTRDAGELVDQMEKDEGEGCVIM